MTISEAIVGTGPERLLFRPGPDREGYRLPDRPDRYPADAVRPHPRRGGARSQHTKRVTAPIGDRRQRRPPSRQRRGRSDVTFRTKNPFTILILAIGMRWTRTRLIGGEEGGLRPRVVGWYNGHPAYRHLDHARRRERRRHRNGNVALISPRAVQTRDEMVRPTCPTMPSRPSRTPRSPTLHQSARRARPRRSSPTSNCARSAWPAARRCRPDELPDEIPARCRSRPPPAHAHIETFRSFAAMAPAGKPKRLHLLPLVPMENLGKSGSKSCAERAVVRNARRWVPATITTPVRHGDRRHATAWVPWRGCRSTSARHRHQQRRAGVARLYVVGWRGAAHR